MAQWRARMLQPAQDGSALIGDDVADADWPAFTLDAAMAQRLSQTLQPGTETKQDEAARVLFSRRRKGVFRATIDVNSTSPYTSSW